MNNIQNMFDESLTRKKFLKKSSILFTTTLLGCTSPQINFSKNYNQLTEDYGELVVAWAGVMDNGTKRIKGRLHLLVYDDNHPCPASKATYTNFLNHLILPGPRKNRKWKDGEENNFNNFRIFKWRKKEDSVLVFVCGQGTKNKIGFKNRKYQPLFCERVVKRNFDELNLYRSSHQSGKEIIAKFQENPPIWLKDVWPKFVDEETHAMYMKIKTIF